MKFTLCYPLDSQSPLHPTYLQSSIDLQKIIDNRIPVFMSEHVFQTAARTYSSNVCQAIITYASLTRKAVKLRFRLKFRHPVKSKYWGFNISLNIPRSHTDPIVVTKVYQTGSPSKLDQDTFNTHLQTFAKISEALLLNAPDKIKVHPEICTPERTREVADLFVKTSLALYQEDKSQKDLKAAAIKAHQERLCALPEGTPLIIHQGQTKPMVQIGAKRGKVSQVLATKSFVPSPETIHSEDFARAGLSRHNALLLGNLAKQALEKDPLVGKLPTFQLNAKTSIRLNPDRPFHETFHNPDTIKAYRSKMETAWVQTSFPYKYFNYFFNGDKSLNRVNKLKGSHPNFPDNAPAGPITSITQFPYTGTPPTLRDFDYTCDVLTVSSRAADIIRAHNIGKSDLKRVSMFDKDGRPLEDRYILVVKENLDTIIMPHLPKDLKKTLKYRAVQNYEIPINNSALCDLDLWTDKQLYPFPLFLSKNLVQALKKAGLTCPSGLRRAEVM